MSVRTYLKTIVLCAASTALLLTSCAKDDLVDFEAGQTEPTVETTFEICSNDAVFGVDHVLALSDIVGKYIKTRELSCGVAGCAEVPTISILFAGYQPTLELAVDGTFQSTEGPFERFESWTLMSTSDTDIPNQLELKDESIPDAPFKVSILDVGACRLRLENVQGWIEYTRLDEV